MFLKNNEFENLISNNINISNYGFKKLFSLYLEKTDNDDKKYIFQNISKVSSISEEDVLCVIEYCSLFNRSYLQIKNSPDESLFNSDYLNKLKIVIDVFTEKLEFYDKKSKYITEFNNEYDYLDLILGYLYNFSKPVINNKFIENLYSKIYNVLNLFAFNDINTLYKFIYYYLSNEDLSNLNCNITFEIYNLLYLIEEHLPNDVKTKFNNNYNKIKKFDLTENFNLLKNIIEVRKSCSDKSLTFYDNGVKMLKVYKENNFFDFSAISLQFYKIIEIELKIKVISFCSKNLNLQNLYNGLCEDLSLSQYNVDFLNKIELGKIRYILRKVKTIMYDLRDDKEVVYFNKDTEEFYNRLVVLFMNVKTINFYLNILHYKAIDTYRNSAVHTGVLSYERAVESLDITNIFLKNINQLNYSSKLSNVLNITLQEAPKFLLDLIK